MKIKKGETDTPENRIRARLGSMGRMMRKIRKDCGLATDNESLRRIGTIQALSLAIKAAKEAFKKE